MLIAPPIATRFFPKLHHHRRRRHPTCTPPHFHSKLLQLTFNSQTKTRLITTNHHRDQRHMSLNTTSENSGDVVVNRRKEVNGGWKYKWNMVTAGAVMGLHLLCGFAPFTFSWEALKVAIVLDLATRLLGINLSFHRNLTHRSMKLPKWLEYTFAYCGVQALQGSPIDWVRTHRFHHQYVDTERDPHTPIKGFWFSHLLWMFDTNNTPNMLGDRNNVRDLEKQFFYRFVSRTYIAHPLALALVLYAFGGLPFIVWGMGVRTVWGYHMTWLVNSVCHGWGDQTWDTRDLSLNNGWVGILGYGDGWHNNHHAFKYSARHGLEWWQIDVTWYVIRFLEIIGLARDVKLPTSNDIQRKTFALEV